MSQDLAPRADKALTVMVSVIAIDLFVIGPAASLVATEHHWPGVVVSAVMMAGVLLVWGNLRLAQFYVAAGIATLFVRMGWGVQGPDHQAWATAALATGMDCILGYLFAGRVFAPGPINLHRVRGAVAIYLLAGSALGHLFMLISLSNPGAFAINGATASHEVAAPHLGYYAFVVLTTLGFGDIVPLHPMARSLSAAGAVFGTLYPAILIGKLVSEAATKRA